ncbi:Vacuolar protein sorting-associated protein 13C like protein [Argiope bruennichi]|uniref:Vacuolar protein sorting-associated protein 13C like protein n=1 Tax=Argiope bruennichi TaxID=94029 RepID=A0A8T0EHN5_ARGBR|nr:Vacuolar protein sorting-associated protein 13C like protein [Argiope bruennichi]
MFEGVVAYALNKYLGRFVEDLDSEQLNVGIFSGTVHLTDLHLKPEALAGFDLPIEVKGGCIGPTADRKYDAERDKRLTRAHKNRRLEDARPPDPEAPGDRPRGFMENLVTTIVNNVQVSLQNVHIRYEDTVSTSGPLACGLVLQNLTAVTTNSKWKATQIDADARSLFKLLKVESLSLYWNPKCPTNTLVKAQLNSEGWKTLLRKGLATFSINGEDFDFIVKPVSLKTKMILNKSKEAKVPKLLLDFVLQDAASQLSREQFVSMYELGRAFELMSLSQRFRKYFRGLSVKGHAADYWRDAYTAVLEEYVRPYTWSRIKEHRDKYRQYKAMYKEHLHRPTDTELKLDLQLLEDSLDVTSILAAREQAKMKIAEDEPSLVRKVPVGKSWSFWSWFSSSGEDLVDGSLDSPKDDKSEEEELLIVGDKDRSWWSRMTAEERRRLFEGIGYERWAPDPEAALNHIGHKLNFTFANCTLSLVNNGKEILVATVTHFLSSLETRPGAKAYKVSARTESIVIEGASLENDLVPIITADNVTSGANVPHIFALDFEKNPSHVNASYGLSITAEPMEVVYHKYAMKELLDFCELPRVSVELLKQKAKDKFKILADAGREKVVHAFAKHKMMHLNVDLKSPYFVIPEHGSLQQGGSVIVLDTGRFTVNTDLQSDVPEESTKMEAEERLYDRFNIALSDIQVLFSDSGEEWRVAKQASESEMHLVPKAKILVVFSNSVRPDCKALPRQKLNISVPSLKLNLSDRRVSMIADFLQNIPFPKSKAEPMGISSSPSDYHLCSHVLREPSGADLKEVWKNLHRKQKIKKLTPDAEKSNNLSSPLHRSLSASDHSDEEEPGGSAERWARVIDLPGFEDNVSASNYIRILFRLVAGEVSIHLARSSDLTDKPYLMLRAEKLCVDAAHMVYGPALQASLHRIQLVDKLHKGSSGEYLELISSDNSADMITVLYRKVAQNLLYFAQMILQVKCDVLPPKKFFLVLKPKSSSIRISTTLKPTDLVLADTSDPPVPPGATKFSISARLNALRVRLCDTELELADLKVAGLETDYVLKANEKSVLRVNLSELTMEDLVEDTLYKKILSTEGDKVFDIKWVRRSPHQKEVMEGSKKDSLPVRVDGSLTIRFGRTMVVLLHTFANELHRFLDPFLNMDTATFFKKSTEGKFQQKVSEFQQSGLRYQVSVEIQAPTILLPQKSTSPNALVLQLGELSVENFFQEEQDHCIDNLLIRLQALQLARAVILLDGRMEVLEPILEPLKLRLDIKRALKPVNEGFIYQVNGSMDLIKVNVGQRDLSTMITIYQDNYAQFQFMDSSKANDISPDAESGPEESVRKLEVFLYTSTDVRKETSFTFIMEGIILTLYTDAEDMRSSNVRDPDQALTSFSLDEASISLETTNDKAIELKCSCQAATLIDLRAPKYSSLRKIFQSYSGDAGGCTGVAGISLSMPPMVDLTYRRTGNGDAAVDAVVEKIRLNVSVSYILGVLKYVSDALPGSRLPSSSAFLEDDEGRGRLPSDCTSGYLSTVSTEDTRALSLSVIFRKPEIVLFAQPDAQDTGVLVLKMDVTLDYSFNLGQGNFVLFFAGLHMLSCIYGRRKHTMFLYPCEVEMNRSLRLVEEEVQMSVSVSSVQLCLSAAVVQTITQVFQQLMANMQEEEDKRNYRLDKEQRQMQDLWSPVSIYKQKWSEPECTCGYTRGQFIIPKYSETLNFSIPEVLVWCEISGVVRNIPVLYAKGSFEAEIKDWSTQMKASGETHLEIMYYNEKISTWEPLLEHVLIREGQYRPLEVMFKVFRGRAHPMVCNGSDELESNAQCLMTTDAAPSVSSSLSSSGNESDDDDVMTTTVIRRKLPARTKRLSSIAKSRDSASFVAYPGDSDSENEDGVLEKIASTFDHLFSEDEEGASDEPPSDSEGIADIDARSDSGETETADNEDVFDDAAPVYTSPHQHHHHEHRSVDALADTALYLTIDCRDTINVNVTPAAISAVQEVLTEFTMPDMRLMKSVAPEEKKELQLKNSLGSEVALKILKKNEKGEYEVVEDVTGRAPKKGLADPDLDDNDGFHMSSTACSAVKRFVPSDILYEEKSIAQLYEESTMEKLQIEVESFDKLACLLPHKTATTMYALQPVKNKTRYFVLVDTELHHGKRTVTVRSPLKIQNHLGRAVHVLCEKASLESAGANPEDYSKNPFQDKFVRLTTLQSGDTYDLPLLVAYHCKLYIRPLPTEGDCKEYGLSTEGIWWKDMTVPQKSSTFLECFAENDTENLTCAKVVCEENRDLKTPSVGTKLVPNFLLHLYPPLVFHNLLPLPIDIHVKNKDRTMRLKEGESAVFFDFDPRQPQEVSLEVSQYIGLQWHGKMSVSGETEELHPVSMSPETDTGLPLQLRGSNSDAVYEASTSTDPVLFRFKKHRKKKAKLRVYSSQWSRSFHWIQWSALKVVVKNGEDFPTTIAFHPYISGDAPVRVDNYCEDLFLKIHQKSQSQVTLLNPYQSVLYTWDDPSQERTLIWNLYNRKRMGFPARITRDGYGFEKVSFHSIRKTLVQQPSLRTSSMEQSSSSDDDSESEDGLLPKKTRKDKVVVHWVSYVEKEQRVLLFTQDDRIARQARKAVDGERASLEFFLSLNGIGLSIVSDAHREIAYASLTSCPAIWEIEINHSWKLLTLELSAWLEDKWNSDVQKAQLKDYLQVDLSKMQMIKPFFGQLRRFYSPAFWLQLRKSPYQTYAHLKIHRFQVDNQLPMMLQRLPTTSSKSYWKVLLQEMHLHLDRGFILSLYDMYSNFKTDVDEATKLQEDLKIVQTPAVDMEQSIRRSRKGISFEYIHLSPTVVHFSFSPRGTVHRATPLTSSLQGDILDLLLNSVGATLTEVKDVEIRLAYFERRGILCRWQDLVTDIRSHYKSQVVQQGYVLVLGLDILGNPYGLLKDFTRGLGDFFYEPYLGSIKGPDEFAESLARGAQSLLGHVIGGSAGAISLVTGSLGQTFSVLTFDDDYRKKRQQRMQLRSTSLPESLCTAAKTFVLGVVLGLSGVVVQPVTGGQQEGVEGFFRGIGKGLLGLITKPAGGVMDMVSMAFDGIRRAAEMGESVVLRMRLPRYINPAEGLRPYSPYLASGCHLLEQVSKGHYAETDVYWAHAALSPHDRTRVALVTDRHLFLLEKGRFWGGWIVEWVISVDDVLTVPHIQGHNLVIKVKQEDWILNFAGDERYVQSDDLQVLEWLKDKVEKVLLYNMRGKPCPL